MLVVLAAAFVSCTPAGQNQEFLKMNQRDSLGRYVFNVEMTDSLQRYDVDFYTRLDIKRSVFRLMDDIRIDALWIAPDGNEYAETVYIPKLSCTNATAFSKEYISPYRKNLTPVIYGKWTLCLTVPEENLIGLKGMGVSYRPSENQ